MIQTVTKFYKIDNSIIEDYDEININLKNYFISMGESFKWKLLDSSDTILEFKTKFDWIWGLEENVVIDFSDSNIKITSFDNGKSPHINRVTERINKNCNTVISGIPEVISKYKSSEFEINRINKIQSEKDQLRRLEEERLSNLNSQKSNIIFQLDKDSNGHVDLIDGESFNNLLITNQSKIIEIDKNYIQKFVKISMYLKTKKINTQKIFDSIIDTKSDSELNELVNLLKNQIHTYELLVFHSISMITSLVESDLITFYEIYECFDQLGVFNSNWENDISGKISNIGDGIKDLMYSIYHMEESIVNSLDNLSYITQDSFQDLSNSMNSQLSSIDSSIQVNNLLTGIQTYQMYKINQNTKRLS